MFFLSHCRKVLLDACNHARNVTSINGKLTETELETNEQLEKGKILIIVLIVIVAELYFNYQPWVDAGIMRFVIHPFVSSFSR